MFEEPLGVPLPEESLSPDSVAVLACARDEAVALQHHYVGTEHLLLGLMQQRESHVARVLAAQTDLESVQGQVRKVAGEGQGVPNGDLPMTPRARQVLHFARREADLYQAEKVAPEHLLIGILREGEGLATQVLLALRVDLSRLRAEAIPRRGRSQRRVRPSDE